MFAWGRCADVKCPGCFQITTVFSHAQTVVTCTGCNTILCQPSGGRARLTEGMLMLVCVAMCEFAHAVSRGRLLLPQEGINVTIAARTSTVLVRSCERRA